MLVLNSHWFQTCKSESGYSTFACCFVVFFQREYQISSDESDFWISLFNSYTKSAHLQTILLFQTTSTFYLPFQSFSKDAGLLHNINDEIELKIDRFIFNLSDFRENIVAMQEQLLIFSAFQFISICNFK